jgi:ADP-ribose pyrophosphatase YjhB (NUDIX family)
VCVACGNIHYDGPTLLVWCYVSWELGLLLCRRAEAPARGLWNPPGGFVESRETLEEAATRELLEETGIQVASSRLKLFGIVNLPHMNQVHVGFHVALTAMPRLLPGPEVLEARFYTQADIPLRELAFRELIGAGYPSDIYAYLRGESSGISSVTVRGSGAQ